MGTGMLYLTGPHQTESSLARKRTLHDGEGDAFVATRERSLRLMENLQEIGLTEEELTDLVEGGEMSTRIASVFTE